MLVSIAVTICFTIRFHHFVTLEAYRKLRLWWWLVLNTFSLIRSISHVQDLCVSLNIRAIQKYWTLAVCKMPKLDFQIEKKFYNNNITGSIHNLKTFQDK